MFLLQYDIKNVIVYLPKTERSVKDEEINCNVAYLYIFDDCIFWSNSIS